MTLFEKSWLVQRLEQPHRAIGQFKDNPFSFGGGYRNGGFTDEAMDLLRGIFSFDYMGAAEFEFGALPKAMNKIANSELAASTVSVGKRSVFVLAPAEWLADVETRVREFARGDYGQGVYALKEATRLRAVLDGDQHTDHLGGWIELDNGFMFFTDETMWSKTCELFGAAVPETAKGA